MRLKQILFLIGCLLIIRNNAYCIYIILDPGHGGSTEPGGGARTIGTQEFTEKDVNLLVGNKAFWYFGQLGGSEITADMTRTIDIKRELSYRVNKANELADSTRLNVVFVSIHHNTPGPGSTLGQKTQVWYNKTDLTTEDKNVERKDTVRTQSELLAQTIANDLNNRLGYPQEIVNSYTDYDGRYVTHNTIVPGVISEASYVHYDSEALFLLNNVNHRENEAWGIFKGVLDYLNKTPGTVTPPNSEVGTISITSNLSEGKFTVIAPREVAIVGSGTSWTRTPVPAGDYVIKVWAKSGYKINTNNISGTISASQTGNYNIQYQSLSTISGTATISGNPSKPTIKEGSNYNGTMITLEWDKGTVTDTVSAYYLEVRNYTDFSIVFQGDIGIDTDANGKAYAYIGGLAGDKKAT